MKSTWLRRKQLASDNLVHKLADQDSPCVRENLVIIGAQDARPFPGIDEAAHIEPLRAAVEVGRHAVRWHAAKLMLSIDAVLRRVGSLIGVLVPDKSKLRN
jgi:hypothetical protein